MPYYVWFHGAPRPYPRLRRSAEGLFGAGVYLSSDLEDALEYGPCVAAVRLHWKNPFLTHADHRVALGYGSDSPAGDAVLRLLGAEAGGRLLRELAHRPFGHLAGELERPLRERGYDGVLARWPSGVCHAVALDEAAVEVRGWGVGDDPRWDRFAVHQGDDPRWDRFAVHQGDDPLRDGLAPVHQGVGEAL